jgi:hypothetical protein
MLDFALGKCAPPGHRRVLFHISFLECHATDHRLMYHRWAIVKDPGVAKKMAEFVVLNTIGASQDAQLRAAGIMRAVVKGYRSDTVEDCVSDGMNIFLDQRWFFVWGRGAVHAMLARGKLFHWSKAVMESRWRRVRNALAGNKRFSIPEPTLPAICTFLGTASSPYPGTQLTPPDQIISKETNVPSSYTSAEECTSQEHA